MTTLGIHDAHDAGAALVSNGVIKGAVNEERFTKKKNDVGFPYHSIKYLNSMLEKDQYTIAVPWIGGSALFGRAFPSLEVKRRQLWRKEIRKPSRLNMHIRNLFFKTIQNQEPKLLWRFAGETLGRYYLSSRFKHAGISGKLVFVDHHTAHASSAYFASGFKEALVITLDGAGDGLSGTVSIGDKNGLKIINRFKASASLGILYGAATLACDMRYSEDEGKLMSLAAYSYPSEIPELNDIIYYNESAKQLISNSGNKYEYLLSEYIKDNILWKYNREAFAYAVQKHVEDQVLKIVKQYIKETGIHNVAVGGGLFSNIIINMKINELPEVKNFFVFPHVGDGGLSLGAAYYIDFMENGKLQNIIKDLYTGPSYSNNEIEDVLKKYLKKKMITYEEKNDISLFVGDMVGKENKIVLWFQGRMEYGPRALGNRSIISKASDNKNRDKINLMVKKRPYYQPFASSILEEDAKKAFNPYLRGNGFMTVGYKVKEEYYKDLIAASHIDGTTRPQTLTDENKKFRELISRVKKHTGIGAILNTSLNKHGKPIVMDPEDAIWTLLNTGAENLAIGDFYVEKNKF
jgi:carbamoyltransferase